MAEGALWVSPGVPSAIILLFGDDMSNTYVRLSYDATGKNPDNLIGSEPHTLKSISGFPYKIITMDNGGFYARSVRVYDTQYNRLILNTDYILTYRYVKAGEAVGLIICSDIVFLDKERVGEVYVTAQMVGSDVAFSLTAITDYIEWWKTQPAGYVPSEFDYAGNEPIWLPGELDKARWELDTFQPFNNEIYAFGRATRGDTGTYEQDFRDKVDAEYQRFLDMFTNRLTAHIDDLDNPHNDNKAQQGLDQVANYKLASSAEALQGTRNDLYLTPSLSWAEIDLHAVQPTNAHINNKANPHRLTPAQIDSPVKTVVQQLLDGKYLRHETVADSSNLSDGVTNYTYAGFLNYARKDIPAGNFVKDGPNGYLSPLRLGRGVPSAKTALLGDGSWVSWDSILATKAGNASPQIITVSGPGSAGQFASQDAGHNMAVSQTWAYTAPVGSMIFYKNDIAMWWGVGNGVSYNSYIQVNASYKSAAGWIKM